MTTKIEREYTFGFLLTESEARRIAQSLHEHADKARESSPIHQCFVAELKDGSRIESEKIDDILDLENAGEKLITFVSFTVSAGASTPKWSMKITFKVPKSSHNQSIPIKLEVLSDSRDWAFLAVSDLEDRIKRVKTIAWNSLARTEIIMPLFLMLMMTLSTGYMLWDTPNRNLGPMLAEKVQSEHITDPIKALIALEQLKAQSLPKNLGLIFIALVGLIPPLFFGHKIIAWASPSYNFLWGDYITYHAKKRQIRSVFWIVIVLGIIVSIVSTVISKKLGLG